MTPVGLFLFSFLMTIIFVCCYLLVDIINKQMIPMRFKSKWDTHYPSIEAARKAKERALKQDDIDTYEEAGLLIERITGKDDMTDINVLVMKLVADKKAKGEYPPDSSDPRFAGMSKAEYHRHARRDMTCLT